MRGKAGATFVCGRWVEMPVVRHTTCLCPVLRSTAQLLVCVMTLVSLHVYICAISHTHIYMCVCVCTTRSHNHTYVYVHDTDTHTHICGNGGDGQTYLNYTAIVVREMIDGGESFKAGTAFAGSVSCQHFKFLC